ncbi:hypothetical protein A2U01_0079827, partial [Trifolium medium]|nr:hypothetical protein [Trifolium medium]
MGSAVRPGGSWIQRSDQAVQRFRGQTGRFMGSE